MRRISTNMANIDMQHSLMTRNRRLNNVQNGIATQSRINELRNDPIAAAHATRLSSHLTHIERYTENIGATQAKFDIAEGYMSEAVDIMQRLKELNVQAAQGTYNRDDLKVMAGEVDQLLDELVSVANARDADGTAIFSGEKTNTPPFRIIKGSVEGMEGVTITSLEYMGTLSKNEVEISENVYIRENFPGNEVFWAENQSVYSEVDAADYIAREDSSIFIDGVEIQLKEGDNIYRVMDKINNSNASVKAELDPVSNALVLNTTVAHQLMIEENGSALEELGILAGDGSEPPRNYSLSSSVYGGSLFDVVINLRDNMLKGDVDALGTSSLKGMESALNNIVNVQAELGSLHERMNIRQTALGKEAVNVTGNKSRLTDIDMTEAVVEMNMLDYVQKASFQVAGKILKPTLMDFLR